MCSSGGPGPQSLPQSSRPQAAAGRIGLQEPAGCWEPMCAHTALTPLCKVTACVQCPQCECAYVYTIPNVCSLNGSHFLRRSLCIPTVCGCFLPTSVCNWAGSVQRSTSGHGQTAVTSGHGAAFLQALLLLHCLIFRALNFGVAQTLQGEKTITVGMAAGEGSWSGRGYENGNSAGVSHRWFYWLQRRISFLLHAGASQMFHSSF